MSEEQPSRYAVRMALRRAYGAHVDDWQRVQRREREAFIEGLATRLSTMSKRDYRRFLNTGKL